MNELKPSFRGWANQLRPAQRGLLASIHQPARDQPAGRTSRFPDPAISFHVFFLFSNVISNPAFCNFRLVSLCTCRRQLLPWSYWNIWTWLALNHLKPIHPNSMGLRLFWVTINYPKPSFRVLENQVRTPGSDPKPMDEHPQSKGQYPYHGSNMVLGSN